MWTSKTIHAIDKRDGTSSVDRVAMYYVFEGPSLSTEAAAYYHGTASDADVDTILGSPTRWLGEGAAVLGLNGSVDVEQLKLVLNGFDPRTGKPLPGIDNAGSTKRRIADDNVASQDKSFSLLLADPTTPDRVKRAIMECHREASSDALALLNQVLITRKGKGGVQQEGDVKLVVAAADHTTSREGDPELHTHFLIMNLALTYDKDGQEAWNAVEFAPGRVYQKAVGAYMRAAMARRVMEHPDLKHELRLEMHRQVNARQRETGDVFVRVAGIDEETRKHFSKRRTQIEEYAAAKGVSKQTANLMTRRGKNDGEPTYAVMQAKWSKDIEAFRAKNPEAVRSFQEVKTRALIDAAKKDPFVPLSDEVLLMKAHEHAHSSLIKRADVLRWVAQEHALTMTPQQILAKTDSLLSSPLVVSYEMHKRDRMQFYAAQQIVDIEKNTKARAAARRFESASMVPQQTVDEVIQKHHATSKHRLSDEQVAGVRHVTAKTGAYAVLSGVAGAGKTSSIVVAKKVWEADGRTVLGVSTSWQAAGKLQADSGMRSYSMAKMLKELNDGGLDLSSKHVIVFDEAGMGGVRDFNALQEHVDKAGAKMVLLGDTEQLAPIAEGAPMVQLTRTIGDPERIQTIRRQALEADRQTVGMFYQPDPDGMAILERLKQREQMKLYETDLQALRSLVSDYFTDDRQAREKLIITGTNEDVTTVSLAIRDGFRSAGQLGADHGVRVIPDEYVSGAVEIALAEGDRVRFKKRDKELGIDNNDLAVIEQIKPIPGGGHRLTVKLESEIPEKDGRMVSFETVGEHAYQDLTYGYAATVHSSQGASLPRSFIYIGEGTAAMSTKPWWLVTLSRYKEEMTLYSREETIWGKVPEPDPADPEKPASREGGVAEMLARRSDRLLTEDMTPTPILETPLTVLGERAQAKAMEERERTPSNSSAIQISQDFLASVNRLSEVVGEAQRRRVLVEQTRQAHLTLDETAKRVKRQERGIER